MWINYFLIFICNIFPILFIYLRVKSINRNPRYPCSLKVVIPRFSMNMYGCCNHILTASLHLCVNCCVLPCWLLCAASLSWLPQAEQSFQILPSLEWQHCQWHIGKIHTAEFLTGKGWTDSAKSSPEPTENYVWIHMFRTPYSKKLPPKLVSI